jgi:SAM-dependent methyltransferase
VDSLVAWLKPKSFLDVGCGLGHTLQYVLAKELEGLGLEGSSAAINASPVREFIQLANLNKPQFLNRKFDLVWSVEVAEHIHPKYTSTYLDTLVRHGDCILLSAAPPGQGGVGHFNEQPQSYWIELMRARGFVLEPKMTAAIQSMGDVFSGNMMLFFRQ